MRLDEDTKRKLIELLKLKKQVADLERKINKLIKNTNLLAKDLYLNLHEGNL